MPPHDRNSIPLQWGLVLSLHFLKLNEQRGEQQRSSPLPWHLSEELAEITSALFDATGFTPDQIRDLTEPFDGLALVADIFPGDKKNVSLYQVKEIWGFSYFLEDGIFTPLALRLEALLVDEREKDPEGRKKEFTLLSDILKCKKEPIHEFLYLRGKNGANWGRVGYVNGALLWPDALAYFVREIFKDTDCPCSQ